MHGKTVAVTGAGGFIGGRLVDRLAAVDCEIVRLTRIPAPSNARRSARITDVVGDVADRRRLRLR